MANAATVVAILPAAVIRCGFWRIRRWPSSMACRSAHISSSPRGPTPGAGQRVLAMTEPLLQAVHRHGRGDVPSAFRPHAVGDGKEPQPRETRHGVVVAVPDKATVRRAGGLDAHGLSRIIMQSAGDGSKKRAGFSE
jgi:hypothetical protein